jgi:hypothetical protein
MSLHVIAYVLESFHFLALVNVTEAEKIDEDYYNGMEGSSSSLSICSHDFIFRFWISLFLPQMKFIWLHLILSVDPDIHMTSFDPVSGSWHSYDFIW